MFLHEGWCARDWGVFEHSSLAVFKECATCGHVADVAVLLYCPLYVYFFADMNIKIVFLVKEDDSNFY